MKYQFSEAKSDGLGLLPLPRVLAPCTLYSGYGAWWRLYEQFACGILQRSKGQKFDWHSAVNAKSMKDT
ncbi:hypothetical protein J6590_055340 [Homalodisca vitripennis]|nr:hypothetical protein J6590_055340 [Homalodisca vitripennis]